MLAACRINVPALASEHRLTDSHCTVRCNAGLAAMGAPGQSGALRITHCAPRALTYGEPDAQAVR